MWKAVLAGTTALTILGSSFAFSQQTPPASSEQTAPAAAQRGRLTADDMAALTDARIAGLKAGLKLTAEQEKNWPAVEAAIRELAKERADRMSARRAEREQRSQDRSQDRPPADAVERLRRGADAMGARANSLKKLADAVEPLYKSLDDDQKRRFTMLMRMGGRSAHGHWRHHHRG